MNGSAPAYRPNPTEAPRKERLTVAELRRARPSRLWGGKGCGVPCDFCRVLISITEVEYEVEAHLDGAAITLHFHPRCHDVWKAEVDGSPNAAPEQATQPTAESPGI